MRMNQRGDVFIPGIIALAAVVGLFVAYVTGHPLPWNKPAQQPVVVEAPIVVDVEPAVAAKVAENS